MSSRLVALAAIMLLTGLTRPSMAADFSLETFKPTGVAEYDDAVRSYLNQTTPKIINGIAAPLNAFPWQSSLGVAPIADAGRAHFCGGALIDATHVVTAAHCVAGLSETQVSVALGTVHLGAETKRLAVRKIDVHPDYRAGAKDADIALLQLENAVTSNAAIAPIALLEATREGAFLAEGVKFTVTGWGLTSVNGHSVRDLRQVDVPFVSAETCADPLAYGSRVTKNMICAGSVNGDACQGDSGGPLVTKSQPSLLIGLVSWGKGCAVAGRVGVYTRVANYRTWLLAQSGILPQ
ncbi:trypsin [Rhizobium sp. PP-F2F-G38]|nr:trypsin [Rhizobium sp. PP-F2F-G38]